MREESQGDQEQLFDAGRGQVMGQRACKRRGSVCKRWKHPAQAPGWRLASLSCSSLARSRSGTSTPIQTRCIHERQESSPVCQVLDKVRLHEIRPKTFLRGVGRKIREASRSKSTRVENLAQGKAKIDLFARYRMIPHELLDGNAPIDSSPDTVHARPAFALVSL